eukprot:gene7683-10453_t
MPKRKSTPAEVEAVDETSVTSANKREKKSVVIEHCKNAFKTRAVKVEKALKDAGFEVTINPNKPRKGAFVITVEGQEKSTIELLNMPRPFAKLKALDIDSIISSIIS